MKGQLLIWLLLMGPGVFGQNLVPNPSFEDVIDCNAPSYLDYFSDWFNPTSSTINRAYHQCLGNIPYIPEGLNHRKYPKRKNGMISILIFYDVVKNSRSYVASSLKEELNSGVQYYIRFYISPKMSHVGTKSPVSDAIGLYLTESFHKKDINTIIPIMPQVESSGHFFENFDHWYRIHGKYTAQGGEKVAVIGNFRSVEDTNYKYLNPSSGSVGNIAEVFIDDVLIEAFDPFPDTLLLCERKEVVLNAGFHDARYAWNTGDRDSVITVNRSGKYRVEATIDTLVFEDSTEVVFIDELSQRTIIDTFLCRGDELWLRSPAPGQYRWSTGDSTANLSVSEEGQYRLSIENRCGLYEFTYRVHERDCDCDLVFPSAFSPNGDRANDVFTVIDRCRYQDWNLESFSVYDKWGGIVYREVGQTVRWDGRDGRGHVLQPGVYTYHLEATVPNGGRSETIVKTGTVQLLR